jgi:putative transposase
VPGPADQHRDLWIEHVNRPQTEGELAGVRASVSRGRPYGDDAWAMQAAQRLDLGATMRPRGRPRGGAAFTRRS